MSKHRTPYDAAAREAYQDGLSCDDIDRLLADANTSPAAREAISAMVRHSNQTIVDRPVKKAGIPPGKASL